MKQIGVNSKSCHTLGAALKLADDAILDITKTSARFDAVLDVLAGRKDQGLSARGHQGDRGARSRSRLETPGDPTVFYLETASIPGARRHCGAAARGDGKRHP